jgi:hypothetical protein
MHGQRWPVVGSLVSLLFLLAAAPPAPKQAPFALAMLRRDGLLIPFASYDGQWKNHWPPPGKPEDMPLSAADIPKAWWPDKKAITAWNVSGIGNGPVNLRPLQVKGVNWFRAGCVQAIALITDYRPMTLPPPPRVRPYPKDALAFSGDVTIDRIDIVGPKDSVVKALEDALPAEVDKKEDTTIESIGHGWKHSYMREERKKVPISLEALYRVPKGYEGRNLYYFEAVKRYFMPKDNQLWRMKSMVPGVKQEPEPERTCDLVTFASGFFALTPQGLIGDLNAKVSISSCDYAQARFMLPLGTVVIDDVRHWIVQWSNPAFESYAILKPNKDGNMEQVFDAGGGACARPDEN